MSGTSREFHTPCPCYCFVTAGTKLSLINRSTSLYLRARQRGDSGRTPGPEPTPSRTVSRPLDRSRGALLLPQRLNPHSTEILRRSCDADHHTSRCHPRTVIVAATGIQLRSRLKNSYLYGDTINVLYNHRPETDPPERHRLHGEGPSQVQVGYAGCLAYISRIMRTRTH
jgi:hypothetical protein